MFRCLVISGAFVLPLLLEFNLRVLLFQVSDESVTDRPTIQGGHLCLGRLRLQDRGLKAPLGRCKGEGQEDWTGGKDGRIG